MLRHNLNKITLIDLFWPATQLTAHGEQMELQVKCFLSSTSLHHCQRKKRYVSMLATVMARGFQRFQAAKLPPPPISSNTVFRVCSDIVNCNIGSDVFILLIKTNADGFVQGSVDDKAAGQSEHDGKGAPGKL